VLTVIGLRGPWAFPKAGGLVVTHKSQNPNASIDQRIWFEG